MGTIRFVGFYQIWVIFSGYVLTQNPPLLKYQWINVEYKWPSIQARQQAIITKQLIVGNARIIDVDVYDNGISPKIIVTTPRFVNGIPAVLSTITNETFGNDPVVAPYPSWEWHQNPELCRMNRLVSVFRIMIDECDRLWVLDTGSINFVPTCPAQILAFDLKTNMLIHRYEIPNNQLQFNSLLTVPVVDVRNTQTCTGTFLYIADSRAFAILVYDVDNKMSWRVTDKTMHAVPDYGTMCVGGSHFELMDGIQGMALSPYYGGNRVLFYHSLASDTEQWVWTSTLRNLTAFVNTSSPDPDIFHVYCNRRRTQSSPMGIDRRGVAYFGLAADTSLNCWNTASPYGERNILQLYKNKETLQYLTGLKVIKLKNGTEEVWFVNTRAERIVTGPINNGLINFRVQKAAVDYFGKCQKSKYARRCVEMFKPCRKCYNCII
ncbi:hypothetical protein FQA39_LY04146 [Lamprigera yunnana]|nr:hypothetical protein FQA39_LY04146 [Lamprigera yunnana]